MAEFRFEMKSKLRASADDVWTRAATMEGVNDELGPWVRMSVPEAARGLGLAAAPLGQEAFRSVLLFLGLLPFDVHHLRLERLVERGFDEESWSWLQRRWRHERRVEPDGDGCVVTDRLTVAPRFMPAFAVKPLVRAVFAARHRTLRERFGERVS